MKWVVTYDEFGEIQGRLHVSDDNQLQHYKNHASVPEAWFALPLELLMVVDVKTKELKPVPVEEAEVKGATLDEIQQARNLGVIFPSQERSNAFDR